jgi:hypothetical protein
MGLARGQLTSSTARRGRAPWPLRLGFGLLLGMFSTLFAEVLAGSDPFPLFHAWGLAVVWPLYLLHILLLAGLLFQLGRPRWPALYLAGVVFGLYEAYLTKQLWAPDWGAALITTGGVAVVETVVLAMFWHPLFAFILPLLVAEAVLTDSRHLLAALPGWARQLLAPVRAHLALPLAAVLCGLVHSSNSPGWAPGLASLLTNALLAVGAAVLWRRACRGHRYSLEELLPRGWELGWLALLLGGMYLLLGVAIRPEALPGAGPQLIIIALYAATIALAAINLCRGQPPAPGVPPLPRWTAGRWLGLVVVAVLTSTAAKLLLGTGTGVLLLIGWVCYTLAGVVAYISAMVQACRVALFPCRRERTHPS